MILSNIPTGYLANPVSFAFALLNEAVIKPTIQGIKNACVVENPMENMFGHDYTKRKEFVWYWFEDLNELKFKPLKTISLPSWGGTKEHQIYELINTHKSKFDLLMKNGVIYMSLEFNLGLKTTKNEYIKAF